MDQVWLGGHGQIYGLLREMLAQEILHLRGVVQICLEEGEIGTFHYSSVSIAFSRLSTFIGEGAEALSPTAGETVLVAVSPLSFFDAATAATQGAKIVGLA